MKVKKAVSGRGPTLGVIVGVPYVSYKGVIRCFSSWTMCTQLYTSAITGADMPTTFFCAPDERVLNTGGGRGSHTYRFIIIYIEHNNDKLPFILVYVYCIVCVLCPCPGVSHA